VDLGGAVEAALGAIVGGAGAAAPIRLCRLDDAPFALGPLLEEARDVGFRHVHHAAPRDKAVPVAALVQALQPTHLGV